MASSVAAAPEPARPAPARVRRIPARIVRYALPAAAALVASIAMGAVYMVYRSPPPPPDVPRPALQTPVTRAATPPALPAAVSDGAPTISVDDLPSVTARPAGSNTAREAPPGAIDTTATAADLFRDANAARRSGEVGKSVDLYRSLIASHPDSAEAHAGRVSLGRLLLDKQGDAAGALAQFDAYLKSAAADRALAEEARLGRALVFQRQGRQEEERRAWQELLERHSDSLYSARARERLRVLAPD
jgi:TolA-binding protein